MEFVWRNIHSKEKKKSTSQCGAPVYVIDIVTGVSGKVGGQRQMASVAIMSQPFPGVHFIFIFLYQSKQSFS